MRVLAVAFMFGCASAALFTGGSLTCSRTVCRSIGLHCPRVELQRLSLSQYKYIVTAAVCDVIEYMVCCKNTSTENTASTHTDGRPSIEADAEVIDIIKTTMNDSSSVDDDHLQTTEFEESFNDRPTSSSSKNSTVKSKRDCSRVKCRPRKRVIIKSRQPPKRIESILFPSDCGHAAIFSRIYGGSKTNIGAFPWMVAIYYSNRDYNLTQVRCGGALINERYVVTAAHCLDPVESGNWQISKVSIGDWDLSTDPDCRGDACHPALEATIETVYVHPNYSLEYRLSHDIALLKLNTRVAYSDVIKPLCLPSLDMSPQEIAIGHRVTVSGWGLTEYGVAAQVLRTVTLSIANPFVCKRVYRDAFDLNGGQICIGGSRNRDTCQGDSGSPVIKMRSDGRYYLLAVTSYGSRECGRPNYPAVYTSVLHYVHWIGNTMIT